MRKFIFILTQLLVFLPALGFAAHDGGVLSGHDNKTATVSEVQKAAVIKQYGKLPLYFIENKGQVDRAVMYYERGGGHATFFTGEGVVLSLTKRERKAEKASFDEDILGLEREESARATGEAVSLSFIGANKDAKIIAGDRMAGKVNYFIGNDRSKWRTGIPTYGAVTYKDVYKNIDVKFYGNNRRLEHDVIVRPGGDFSLVKFAYKGAQGLKVTEDGGLDVILKNGNIREQRPVIYQEIGGRRVAIDGSYKILGKKDGAFTYGFAVASYDHTKKLVIDPVLVYSTYLGGTKSDMAMDIAVDSSGNAYVTGSTQSTDFPLASPIQGTMAGITDIFVTKINATGSAIVYSTYLGGSVIELPFGIAVDATGSAYITGYTASTDFPLASPVQGTSGGFQDAFVTKINATGSALVYSTYLGGLDADAGNDIAVDASGNAYVTGNTSSTDFPLASPLQGTFGGLKDAFVTKINAAGSVLLYSTYLGGTGLDFASAIAVDASGNAYITGDTFSTDFPLMNPMQGTIMTGGDTFVTKINAAGSALVYSTYLGGFSSDHSGGIAVDNSGAAYVTGRTLSTDFPLVNPIQASLAGSDDVYLSKLDPAGASLLFSTFFGGTMLDAGFGIALDSSGNVYVTGQTSSPDLPLANPIQAAPGGGIDGFVFNPNNA